MMTDHVDSGRRRTLRHRRGWLAFSLSLALIVLLVAPLSAGAADPPTLVTINLAPASQNGVVGNQVSVTATVTVTATGIRVPNVGVAFSVAGANSATTGKTVTTGTNGQATFSYTGTNTGTDTISAQVGAATDTATVTWSTTGTGTRNISLSPSTSTTQTNTSRTFTATVTNNLGGAVANVPVVYSVSGANTVAKTSAGSTDGSGVVTFSYTGTNAGTDTVTVFADVNGNTVQDSGEPSATATATWVAANTITLTPTSLTVAAGNSTTVTAKVVDTNNNPLPNITVSFTVTGANPQSGTATTDANGNATITLNETNPGTDQVSVTTAGVSTAATATVQVVSGAVAVALTTASGTATTGTQTTITATVTNASGAGLPNVVVRFSVTGANPNTGSATTDSTGKATFSYTGANAGTDTVSAYADLNNNGTKDTGEPAATNVTVTWAVSAVPTLALAPASQTAATGSSVSVGATLGSVANLSGVTIRFSVSGANSKSGTATTDSNGKATFSYTGANSGADTVTAYADLNNNNTQDSGEPSATATVTWSSPTPPPSNVILAASQSAQPKSAPSCTYFPATHHNLCAGFHAYWDTFGGLAVYGYPLTEEFVDPGTGLVTQYFERARFEWHPGAWPSRFDVELGLLGNELTAGRQSEAPFQKTTAKSDPSCIYFAATGHNLCAGFHAFWDAYGGLAVYGMPISEEFVEKNPDTGQMYTVQYFERQRFEWHPGEAPQRYDVLLGRLGAQILATKYGVNVTP